jgi:hypothetical protein
MKLMMEVIMKVKNILMKVVSKLMKAKFDGKKLGRKLRSTYQKGKGEIKLIGF